MPKLDIGTIPGYAEAVESETLNRELAYLGADFRVCGVALRALTPAMLTELYAVGSPFVCGGIPTHESVATLLVICGQTHEERRSKLKSWRFARGLKRTLRKLQWGLIECVADIEQYIDTMFQDAPTGRGGSIPYACTAAWMEFEMSGNPWRWDRARTMATPIPIIYQQIRCLERSRGNSIVNQSDYVRARWLDSINSKNQELS